MRVLELGNCLGFTLKTKAELGVSGSLGWQEFDGDRLAQGGMDGFVNFCHAAVPDQLHPLIFTEARLFEDGGNILGRHRRPRRLLVIHMDVVEASIHETLQAAVGGLENGSKDGG